MGVADELTRALGLLAAHGVLQLNQSAAKAEHGQQQWAGEAAQAQDAAQAYGASASYGSSYGSSYGYAQPAAPAPQPPGSIKNYPPREKTPPGESSGPPCGRRSAGGGASSWSCSGTCRTLC